MNLHSITSNLKWFFFGIVALVFFLFFKFHYNSSIDLDESKKIYVLTYNSFFSPGSAGEELKEKFEATTGLKIIFIDGGDSSQMIEQLKQFTNRQIDIVVGLSILDLYRASEQLNWTPLISKKSIISEIEKIDFLDPFKPYFDRFLPFDWSPLGWIYNSNKIESFDSLESLIRANKHLKGSAPDPKFTMPGNFLSLWSHDTKNKNWNQSVINHLKFFLEPLSPSWSSSYGQLTRGLVDLTFSYATSVYYHKNIEKVENYKFAEFKSGHPFEVEWYGIPASCFNCSGALTFADYLLTSSSQVTISNKNFMLPILDSDKNLSQFKYFKPIPLVNGIEIIEYSKNSKTFAREFSDFFNE